MRSRTLEALLVLAIAAAALSVPSCSKKKPTPAAQPPTTTAAASGTAQEKTAAPRPPAPVRHEGLSLEPFSTMLPSQTEVLAVFPASTMYESLRSLCDGFVQLATIEGSKDLPARLESVYGVDEGAFGPLCAFAVIKEAGAVLLCESRDGGKVTNPEGHDRFKNGQASGHAVTRGDWRVLVGTIGGMLIAGSEAAIDKVVMVERGDWPPLKLVIERKAGLLRPMAAADPWGDVRIHFLDPSVAPWCPDDACLATAMFVKLGARVLLVANAADGKVPTVKDALESFEKDTAARFAAIRDTDRLKREPPVPDGSIKPADLLVTNAELSVRDFQISLTGPGDALFLAAILNPDLVSAVLGPPVELMKAVAK